VKASFFEEDFESKGVHQLFKATNIPYILGLPTPGLFKQKIDDTMILSKQLHHENIFGTILYMTSDMKPLVFNVIHVMCEKDRSDLLATLLNGSQFSYIACPVSPIRYSAAYTAKVMYNRLKNMNDNTRGIIYSRLTLPDLLAILHLPDRERYGFFEDFCIESTIFKDAYSCEEEPKYAELNHLYLC
jgi:hypothetical protein